MGGADGTRRANIRTGSHGPSFLRWAGSKRSSLSILGRYYTDGQLRYVEPFAGSAALFFSLKPASATLADLNGQLINAFRHVRDNPKGLYSRLIALGRTSEVYYEIRDEFNASGDHGLDAAVYFIYLNRNCFNGLWRTNRSGKFNVPFGGHEIGDYPPLELFVRCSQNLKSAKLCRQDFRKTIAEAGPGHFVYADPPYFSANERVFVEYGKRSFSQSDLEDLVSELVLAERRGVQIALTYNETDEIPGLPSHWCRTTFEVTRNVGGFAGSRKRQREVLFSSFDFAAGQ
jgi:DNA adenine methylase